MECPSCHHSDTWNFEIAPRFLENLCAVAINPYEYFGGPFWTKTDLCQFWFTYDILLRFLWFIFLLILNVLSYLQTVVYCLVREAPGLTALDRIHSSLEKFGIAEFDKELELRVVPIRGTVWQQSSLSCIVWQQSSLSCAVWQHIHLCTTNCIILAVHSIIT